MRIVEPKVELIGRNVGVFNRHKHVELCGRVCYKSESHITDDSAEKFIAGIIKRGHEAVLEHARITLNLTDYPTTFSELKDAAQEMRDTGLTDYMAITNWDVKIISGNIRAWRNLFKFMKANAFPLGDKVFIRMWHENAPFFPEFTSPDDPYVYDTLTDIDPDVPVPVFESKSLRRIHSWYTLRFTCDRGVSHEIVRHRPASYCQESTRYCNYSKADFGCEIAVIRPFYLQEGEPIYDTWKRACEAAESAYFTSLTAGYTPQQARCVLPTSLKTELIMTATADEWLHFLNLRTAEAAHPQMREVATRAKEILKTQDPEVFSDEQIRDAR